MLGCAFVGIGFAGYVLPLLPGTVFMILALWCFKRGNERLENYLLNHRRIGPTLRDWERDRSITRRTKITAITLIWLCLLISMFMVRKPWVLALLPTIGVAVSLYLATRPTADPSGKGEKGRFSLS